MSLRYHTINKMTSNYGVNMVFILFEKCNMGQVDLGLWC